MLLTLLESKRHIPAKRFVGGGFVSVTVHTAVIVGTVFATLQARLSDDHVRMDTTVVLLESQTQQQKAPEPLPLDAALKGFQTLVVPAAVPTNIPPVDLQEHFDPKDYSGAGVEGGRASGLVPDGNEVYAEAIVEEKPALLSAAPPTYPNLLREAGIQGRVILRAIVDTAGRIEPSSIKILQTPNPAFNEPTRQWVLKALFRPARLHGHAVRSYVNLPVDYSLISS
jgi:protein TonB